MQCPGRRLQVALTGRYSCPKYERPPPLLVPPPPPLSLFSSASAFAFSISFILPPFISTLPLFLRPFHLCFVPYSTSSSSSSCRVAPEAREGVWRAEGVDRGCDGQGAGGQGWGRGQGSRSTLAAVAVAGQVIGGRSLVDLHVARPHSVIGVAQFPGGAPAVRPAAPPSVWHAPVTADGAPPYISGEPAACCAPAPLPAPLPTLRSERIN